MIDVILDFETLGKDQNCKVVELSVLCFDQEVEYTFQELVDKAIKIKFDLKSQTNRNTLKSTVEWWKNQSKDVQKLLLPSDNDVTIKEGIKIFEDYLLKNGVDRNSQLFCRGPSFDIPIFNSLLKETYDVEDTFEYEPIKFWNQRDVRTRIEALLLSRGMTETPLPENLLDGFVKHNSIHDCAKDVLMLQYAYWYATGKKEVEKSSVFV